MRPPKNPKVDLSDIMNAITAQSAELNARIDKLGAQILTEDIVRTIVLSVVAQSSVRSGRLSALADQEVASQATPLRQFVTNTTCIEKLTEVAKVAGLWSAPGLFSFSFFFFSSVFLTLCGRSESPEAGVL